MGVFYLVKRFQYYTSTSTYLLSTTANGMNGAQLYSTGKIKLSRPSMYVF